MRRVNRPEKQRDRQRVLRRSGGGGRRRRQLIVFAGARRAASSCGKSKCKKQTESTYRFHRFHPHKLIFHFKKRFPHRYPHGCPGLCSFGVDERINVEGCALMMAVNSRKFSVAWRMFSNISSMFSAFESSVLLSCVVSCWSFARFWRSS